MRKLLLIAADQERLGTSGADTLKTKHGAQLTQVGGSDIQVIVATPDEASPHFADAEIVAAFPLRMPPLDSLPNAKWLHSFSAGVDKILTPELAQSEILLTNSSGVHATPIAETILAYLLMFARGFTQTIWERQQHVWHQNDHSGELRDSTVLIVGLGEIGTETARICNAFGSHVWATVRTAREKPNFVEHLETGEKLDEFLPHADYVVITLPQTEETHYLFDKTRFALMKKSAVIVNIGRGGIIKEADLIEALKEGTIAGAALDVFEKEPLPDDSPLWDMPNVVITPHHSGLSLRYMDRAIEVLSKNIKAYLKGEPLPNIVDKRLGY